MQSPVLDMRLTGSSLDLRDVRHRRPLIYVGSAGLAAGLMLALGLQLHLQALRDEEQAVRTELQSLRSTERELQLQLQALRESQAQRRRQQAHRDRWDLAGQSLRLLGRLQGAAPSAQLTEVRLDAQGLTASGQMASAELQPWLQRLSQQTIGLGARSWLEIGGGLEDSAAPSASAQESQRRQRFWVRLGLQATSGEAQR